MVHASNNLHCCTRASDLGLVDYRVLVKSLLLRTWLVVWLHTRSM